ATPAQRSASWSAAASAKRASWKGCFWGGRSEGEMGFAQKSETRSTKSETNPKLEIQSSKQAIDAIQVSDFGFRACFGFRYSDFEFLGKAALPSRLRLPTRRYPSGRGSKASGCSASASRMWTVSLPSSSS